MRQSDLKHADEIVRLLLELTRNNRTVQIFDSVVFVNGKPFVGQSLVECLRAAKADEPNKEAI